MISATNGPHNIKADLGHFYAFTLGLNLTVVRYDIRRRRRTSRIPL